jgi:poly-beta-1,6-N-acetyl-D-glucosamine synthase
MAGAADVAIGVMAYNEERNIGALLDSMLSQSAFERIARVVIVASGCTDKTCEIIRTYSQREPRILLIEEPSRTGKIAAVNKFLMHASEELLIVSSADLIYDKDALQELLRPFADPEVGMAGAHAVPVNDDRTFFGFAANLMWSLHHEIALHSPKMGELVAFRNVFRRLDPGTICDELSVHQLMRSAGYKIVYVPESIVYNKGCGNLRDFISQRMHCIVGNFEIMRDHNVPVPTMRTLPVLHAALAYSLRHPSRLHWIAATAFLELACRIDARLSYRSKAVHTRYQVWDPATSTKALAPDSPAEKATVH